MVLIVDGTIREQYSIPLGNGTNNIGEVYGIGTALERADELVDDLHDIHSPSPINVYIISDSSFAIGAISLNHHINPNPALSPVLSAAKQRWRDLADRVMLHLVKIKAHAGIRGNVVADALAGRASSLSSGVDSWRLRACRDSFLHRPP